MRLWIEETPRLWEAESIAAGQAVTCYDHVEEGVWRHLNVFEHRCEIRCRLPRGRRVCDATSKVYRMTPPWEGLAKHFTKGFEAMVRLLLRQMPVAAVARHVGETDTRLWRMLHAHVARAWPQVDWSGVVCVGCDELSARKGHRYVSVFLRSGRQARALRGARQGQDHVGGVRHRLGRAQRPPPVRSPKYPST